MRVGIIGAGASGMMAAVTAAKYGAEVVLLEKNDRVGKKILVTGNGKCNISNLEFNMDQYYCQDKEKLCQMFRVHSVWDTISFFESNGLMIRSKNGYLYPYSEQASTVLDIFRKLLEQNTITVITGVEIEKVCFQKRKNNFLVKGKEYGDEFDKLIIACGGPASQKKGEGLSGYRMAERFGHKIERTVPGLVSLRVKESFIKGMAGVRCQARLELMVNEKTVAVEEGELQFAEYGISGIPVFQLSREAAYALKARKKVQIKINLLPDYEEQVYIYMMCNRYESQKECTLETFLLGMTNKKINLALIKRDGLNPSDKVSELGFTRVSRLLLTYQNLIVHIEETSGMEKAQVCAGGIDFSEVSTEMESLKQKGLYFAGELLDVDGKCGGYNLQWAWTSGYIAGRNAAGNSTQSILGDIEEEIRDA